MARLEFDRALVRNWIFSNLDARETGTPDEIAVRGCPLCGDERTHRLYFNDAKGVGICYRCSAPVPFLELVQRTTGAATLAETLRELALYRVGAAGRLFAEEGPAESPETWAARARAALREACGRPAPAPSRFPPGWSTDWATPEGAFALAYAKRRAVPAWFLALGRLGFFREGSFAGRLVLLVHEGGRPVFFMGRAWEDWRRPKMLYPARREWGSGASDHVFNLDLQAPGQALLVCEGALSALSAGRAGVAALGGSLSEVQAAKIAAAEPSEVVILREAEIARERAAESAFRLASRGVRASVADLLAGDPNDNPAQVPAAVAGARPVRGRGDLLRERLGALKRRGKISLA